MSIFSVPALISDAAVRTRTPPDFIAGGGTVSNMQLSYVFEGLRAWVRSLRDDLKLLLIRNY
jgi:hypothetical protein